MLKIRLVCGTRLSEAEFYATSALGRSLRLAFADLPNVELTLFPGGNPGLPVVYNQAIRDAAARPAVLLFIHDDVHLLDLFWPDRLYMALEQFQIVGLVGSRRRLPRQPGWRFKNEWFALEDAEHLSGVIAHGDEFPSPIQRFGMLGPCKLLDGVFLAARSETLIAHDLAFDDRFDFNCWDLDFCRQAEAKGVTMGTTPIGVLHQSIGKYRTPAWSAAFQTYCAKWGE